MTKQPPTPGVQMGGLGTCWKPRLECAPREALGCITPQMPVKGTRGACFLSHQRNQSNQIEFSQEGVETLEEVLPSYGDGGSEPPRSLKREAAVWCLGGVGVQAQHPPLPRASG